MAIESYYWRAWNAYYRRYGPNAPQPSGADGFDNFREWEGRKYVVLDNRHGVLAVYRITNAGQLRFMVRPPKAALVDWGYDPE